MASIQQRLQLKRSPLDTWSVREQLCLVSSVARSGDQNWVSVSRSLKTVGDPSRPPDWYNQKACAAQYGALLEHADTPKRKKRASEGAAESAQESLMKRLTQERIAEIQKVMADIAQQYQIVQEEIVEVRSPDTSEARLREMSASVDAARRQRERDQHKQAAWMKERDERRRQAEKARRPSAPTPPGVSQSPPAASPLLTSLLKNTSPTGAAPAPARLLHIPHPSTVPDKVSPSAGAPTLSMLLEKGSASLSSAPSAAPPAPSLITVYAPTLPPIQAQAQSLLVQAQPLPVQTQPLPVQSQPLPVQGQPLPVQGQPLPVQGQPLPVQGQPLPVQGQPLLVQGQPLQVQGQPLLVQAQPLPVQAQPLPVQGQQLLVHGQPVLLQGQPLPVQGQLLPVQVQSLPVQAQSLPIQAPPSLQPSNKHAVIEQIKNQLQEIEHSLRLGNIRGSPSPVSLVPQAVLPVAPPPEQMMPVTTDKIDIDDIEIKAEDVYAFSDIDIDIPPVSTIHKNSLTRSIEKGLFNKKECLDDMSAPVEFEPPPVCTQDDSTQPRPDLPPLQSEFQAVPAAEEAVEVIPEPPPAEVKEEIPEAPQMIQAKEPQDQDNFECVPASIPLPTPLIPLPEPLIPLPEPLIPLPEPLIPLPEPLIPLPASLIPLPASLIPLPAESAPAPPPEPTETTDPAVGVPERGTEEAAAPPEEASTVGPPPVPPEDQLPEEQLPEEPPEPAPIMSQEPPPVEEQTEVPKNEPQLEEPDQPPRDEEAGKSDAKLDEPAVTVKEESPEAEVEPEEPEALHEKVAAKEEPEPRQTEVEGPAGGEVKVEKEWDGGAEGGGGDGETAADEKPSEPEETHTETDDDTPMELIREEEKGGRKRRDYSRRKTTLPADSRACSESESTAETSAPSSPLPAPPGGGAPSSPLPAPPGGGTPSTPGSATPGSTHGDPDRDHRLWKKSVMLVYSRLCAHKYASLFLRPITDEQAPDYSVVVRRPMDLTTIKRNIDAGIIRTTAEFQRDVLLMLCNALMYNPSTHRVHVMARDMHREAAAQLGMLLQAQAHAALADSAAEPPVRRSLPHNKRKRPGSPPHATAGSPLPKTRRLDD